MGLAFLFHKHTHELAREKGWRRYVGAHRAVPWVVVSPHQPPPHTLPNNTSLTALPHKKKILRRREAAPSPRPRSYDGDRLLEMVMKNAI